MLVEHKGRKMKPMSKGYHIFVCIKGNWWDKANNIIVSHDSLLGKIFLKIRRIKK